MASSTPSTSRSSPTATPGSTPAVRSEITCQVTGGLCVSPCSSSSRVLTDANTTDGFLQQGPYECLPNTTPRRIW
jgi:hypothetical protein